MVVELTADNFEKEVMESKLPVLVDFWAPWCGPCQQLIPVFAELSKEFDRKIKFAKINVDENQDLAQKYSVRGIPCLILFKDEREADRIVGSVSIEELRKKLDLALANWMT